MIYISQTDIYINTLKKSYTLWNTLRKNLK